MATALLSGTVSSVRFSGWALIVVWNEMLKVAMTSSRRQVGGDHLTPTVEHL